MMAKRLTILAILALLPLTLILGCGELGQVDQGRVVAFDKDKSPVTLIQDKRPTRQSRLQYAAPPYLYFAHGPV